MSGLSSMYIFLIISARSYRFYEKSTSTRTETLSNTVCFRNPCYLLLYFSREKYFYLPFIAIRTWNYVPISFLSCYSQKLCLRQLKLINQRQLRPRNSLLTLWPQKANPCNEVFWDLCKLETLNGRVCNVLRGQIFTLNLWPSSRSRTLTCNCRNMSRMYNTVGAPGEFFPLASIVRRQLIYYFCMNKLIYPTYKTPWWCLLLSDETPGR